MAKIKHDEPNVRMSLEDIFIIQNEIWTTKNRNYNNLPVKLIISYITGKSVEIQLITRIPGHYFVIFDTSRKYHFCR